ncbi:hypothetical protein [Dyadobacter sp. 32]|uniref:hypothetical protein n=1 Tax=Dyadobacter sp. 32 TaxID=538966 RepID=UPI0011EF93CA
MKTDKFEKTIRQKLESISPDFQESDWAKMQNYMHAHTPPTLWQQYGSWLGYAAAASVTSVMAFLYVNQLSQNNKLGRDVKSLQSQIATIKENPAATPKVDTIYVLRDAVSSNQEDRSQAYTTIDAEEVVTNHEQSAAENTVASAPDADRTTEKEKNRIQQEQILYSDKNSAAEFVGIQTEKEDETLHPGESNASESILNTTNTATLSTPENGVLASKTLGARFENISTQSPLTPAMRTEQLKGALMSRLSARQIRKTWMASTAASYKAPTSGKKAEQITQTENVIPQLNLKVPYRFGAGMEWQKNVQAKTVTGEVILGKRFSISAGLSWLKLKQMQFFNEKGFREANKRDFKQTHPNQVPAAFVVTNIQIEPTMMQIPLTVAFRNELKDNWAYYVAAGANVTVKSNEKISFSCIVPKPQQEILTQSFERKMDISPINSLNFSLGVEKAWHPIVVQAEGYMYSYFKPLTPLNPRSGPGFKVKLLYQIGKKM